MRLLNTQNAATTGENGATKTFALRGIHNRRFPMLASWQDLDHEHATFVTNWAFPQQKVGEFLVALGVALARRMLPPGS
jgi:hypothetical protein